MNTSVGVSILIKLQNEDLKTCNLIKKWLHRPLLVYFAKFLRTSFLQNTSRQLLLPSTESLFLEPLTALYINSVQLAWEVIVDYLPCPFAKKCHQRCPKCSKTRAIPKLLVKGVKTLSIAMTNFFANILQKAPS